MVKRSISVTEMMIEREELSNIEEGRSRVEYDQQDEEPVAPLPALPYATYDDYDEKKKDAIVVYPKALAVYEPIRNALEPEAPKIEDVPTEPVSSTAIVLVEPPKEPEGGLAPTPPKRTSRRRYHHDQDKLYVCSHDELPQDVRDKQRHGSQSDEKPVQNDRRAKRRPYSDKLKESFRINRKEDHQSSFGDYDAVLETIGTDETSESRERKRKSKSSKKKKSKKKSKDHRSSSSHRRHKSNGEASSSKKDGRQWSSDSESDYETPSIATNNPQDTEVDRRQRQKERPSLKSPMGRRLSVSDRIFASFRRSKGSPLDIEISDDDSVQDC